MISTELIKWVVIFVVSLYFLLKSSDYFTKSAEKIGLFFGISPFIIGVSIVAFGTSLPELISSILAVMKNSSEIVVGNVIGSNITNIFLILGVVAIIGKKITLDYDIAHVDLPILIGSALLFGLMTWDGDFSFREAMYSIAGIIIFLWSAAGSSENKKILRKGRKDPFTSVEKIEAKTWIILVLSIGAIYLSATYTVESIIQVARIINVSTDIIAATGMALGTSLPELVVSGVAAKNGKPGVAVGNILGSNVFNTFAVMGIPALFGKIQVSKNMIYCGMPIMVIATFMFFFIAHQKRITKYEGWLLIIFYLFFLGNIITCI